MAEGVIASGTSDFSSHCQRTMMQLCLRTVFHVVLAQRCFGTTFLFAQRQQKAAEAASSRTESGNGACRARHGATSVNAGEELVATVRFCTSAQMPGSSSRRGGRAPRRIQAYRKALQLSRTNRQSSLATWNKPLAAGDKPSCILLCPVSCD